jgi:two-component system NtrC family response regulator
VSKEPVLLVIEDDPGIQKQLKWSFDGFLVKFADSHDGALRALRLFEPPVVTLDLGLPPDPANASIGLALLSEILALAPSTKVIVVTGNDDRENAIKSISHGAYDYYQKPIDPDVLRIIVERAFQLYQLEQENRRLSQVSDRIQGVIGDSPKMVMVCKMIEKVANTEVTALLLGESGTGKEVFARAIHQNSPRVNKPFVAINCASIPENLLESELFGYEKGAFTGAVRKTKGKVETAQGGTLFLDEIGDMPLSLQAKLLRFLQERVIEPVGGRVEIPVDVRVVCATNKDIARMSVEQTFREDLYYRVSEVTIHIPPLRERDGDVLLLARAFLNQYSQEMGRNVKGFTDDALNAMSQYSWPGNIRELQNKMKSAVIMSEGGVIDAIDLGLMADSEQTQIFNLRSVREKVDIKLITQVIAYTGNNMSRASELLGITRPTLYSLLDKYGLSFEKS